MRTLLVLIVIGLLGCAESHSMGAGSDARAPDAFTNPDALDSQDSGARSDTGALVDAGSGADAGREVADAGSHLDSGLACARVEPGRIDFACIGGGAEIAPGTPHQLLNVTVSELAYCFDQVVCSVAVRAPGQLELTTEICISGNVCDGGTAAVGACVLPPLDAGIWTVWVNGLPGFDLAVGVSSGSDLRCWSVAPPENFVGGLICEWPGAQTSTTACHRREAVAGELVELTARNDCGTCFQRFGACEVEVEGNEIRVRTFERNCDCPVCGACPPVCELHERTCLLPALPAGDYRVTVDDIPQPSDLRLVAGPAAADIVCASAP